jgi:hypothetical protein
MNYKKIYDDLISKARSENRIKGGNIYYEAHHIIPKCLDGEGNVNQWKKHPNIILLTAKEHFVSHKLLCEIYPDNYKLVYALYAMIGLKSNLHNRNYKISSREYERLRINISKIKSVEYIGEKNPNFGNGEKIIGEKNPNFGKKWTQEQKQKQSKIQKGKLKNYKWSNDRNLKLSKTLIERGTNKGKNNPNYGKRYKLPQNTGGKNPSAKKIINIDNGIIYSCIKEVSELFNINYSTLCSKINGSRKNNTPFKYYEE